MLQSLGSSNVERASWSLWVAYPPWMLVAEPKKGSPKCSCELLEIAVRLTLERWMEVGEEETIRMAKRFRRIRQPLIGEGGVDTKHDGGMDNDGKGRKPVPGIRRCTGDRSRIAPLKSL